MNLTVSQASMLVSSPNPFPTGYALNVYSPSSMTAYSAALPAYTGDFSVSFWVDATAIDGYTFITNDNDTFSNTPGIWRFAPHNAGQAMYFDIRTRMRRSIICKAPF